jgi:2,3-bisphosphoglycerate-independent phosphoglycerate mutase
MGFIFLFIDGIGVGKAGASNPFSTKDLTGFGRLAGGQKMVLGADHITSSDHLFKTIDARLGIEGLPQSGTGQATLFSGENASVVIGRHFGPYPHSGIRFLLEKNSLFHQITGSGKSAHFINAYPDVFFERASARNRWSCTTLMTRSAGLNLNRVEDVLRGDAVTAEIMQDVWRSQLSLDVPEIKPDEAARRIVRKADEFDLVLYEYYLTDKAGHSMNPEMAGWALERLDSFISAILEHMDTSRHTFILTSDHGNLEELGIKTHTMNDVPLVAIGRNAHDFSEVRSLTDVTPALLDSMRSRIPGS